jgi:hypothetical protein
MMMQVVLAILVTTQAAPAVNPMRAAALEAHELWLMMSGPDQRPRAVCVRCCA